MPVGAGELGDDVSIPVEAQPAQTVQDGVDRRLGGAGTIGILDAQEELPAMVSCEKPVEQRRAGAADMQETRRRRREAGADGVVFVLHVRIDAALREGKVVLA